MEWLLFLNHGLFLIYPYFNTLALHLLWIVLLWQVKCISFEFFILFGHCGMNKTCVVPPWSGVATANYVVFGVLPVCTLPTNLHSNMLSAR